MSNISWQEIHKELEIQKKLISRNDFRFYNIAHLPLIARKSEEFSEHCIECKNNIAIVFKLVKNLPAKLEDKQSVSNSFENKVDSVVKHLKEEHSCRFHGYYVSLYTAIGVLAGIILSLALSLSTKKGLLSELTLGVLLVGLIVGRIVGVKKDKQIFKSGRQI